MGKNKNFGAIWRRLYGFCWGGGTKTDPLFCEHVLSPVSVHHRGWVGFALRCTQSTMGLKVAYLQLWLVKG